MFLCDILLPSGVINDDDDDDGDDGQNELVVYLVQECRASTRRVFACRCFSTCLAVNRNLQKHSTQPTMISDLY